MNGIQHVWLRAEATTYLADCELCLYTRAGVAARDVRVTGTLRPEADVGFTSCRRGHRIVVRRITSRLATAV